MTMPEIKTEPLPPTPRWTRLRYHPEQNRFWHSEAPRIVVPAGRRSGKTEIAMRRLVLRWLRCEHQDGRFVAGAPTHAQAKELFWRPLKQLIPRQFVGRMSESELEIERLDGVRLQVRGMDRPERIEGSTLDGILMDEYASMRRSAWQEHVQPALSTRGREGWAMFTGVPEGRNHYYDLYLDAESDDSGHWATFHWLSADILSPEVIERARRELDERTFQQEYEASFVDFAGRAYYAFDAEIHASRALQYDPKRDLIFCLDFNRAPGTAAVLQEQELGTCVLGEVWKESYSNTEIISKRLAEAWKHHEGLVKCYGDATGGAGGSAKTRGSDWEIVRSVLKRSDAFGERCRVLHSKANPRVAVRVNALNARLRSADGRAGLFVDPVKAPHVVRDLEGVTWVELADKRKAGNLTHLSDGLGYYVERVFPFGGGLAAA